MHQTNIYLPYKPGRSRYISHSMQFNINIKPIAFGELHFGIYFLDCILTDTKRNAGQTNWLFVHSEHQANASVVYILKERIYNLKSFCSFLIHFFKYIFVCVSHTRIVWLAIYEAYALYVTYDIVVVLVASCSYFQKIRK